ncbi:HNH endonuclease signature motif containing protein [Dactylosporangium fulvum]
MAVIDAALGKGPASGPWAWSDEDLLARDAAVHALIQRATAAQLAIVRELDGRALPKRHGQTSAQWLRTRHRISTGSAHRLLNLAAALDRPELAATTEALADGTINTEQAAAIAEAVADLPAAHRRDGERLLLDEAAQSDRHGLRVRAGSLLEEVDPEEHQRRERDHLEKAAEAAHRARAVHIRDVPGTQQTRITAVLSRPDAALIREAIDALCSPRRDRCSTDDGHPLPLPTARQLRADALVDLIRIALACGELPDHGGDRPQVTVTIPLQTLRDDGTGLPAARLDDGTELSPGEARRIACDAQIVPAVLGGPSQVLDLGQSRRLFTGAVRRALILRDHGCAFPGCDRPPKWCDGHHIRHWAHGGATTVDNGVMLCHAHHKLIHFGEWVVRLNPVDGLPEFTAPAYLDPARTVRRNTFHRRT